MKTREQILAAACTEGRAWAGERTLAQIWRECKRGDWLIWLLRHSGAEVDKEEWVRLALAVAERALVHVPAGEDRPRLAVEAAKAWLADQSQENAEKCHAAANAANAANAADAVERKQQADDIRRIIPCPF